MSDPVQSAGIFERPRVHGCADVKDVECIYPWVVLLRCCQVTIERELGCGLVGC